MRSSVARPCLAFVMMSSTVLVHTNEQIKEVRSE